MTNFLRRHKRKFLILGSIPLLLLLLILGFDIRRQFSSDRDRITDALPTDVDGDGRNELLVLYSTSYYGILPFLKHSILELRDLRNDRVLWRVYLKSFGGYYHLKHYSMKTRANRLYVLLHNAEFDSQPASYLYTINLQDGDVITRHHFKPPTQHYGPLPEMLLHQEKLYVLLSHGGENFENAYSVLYTFKARTGKLLNSNKSHNSRFALNTPPFIHGNHLIIHHSVFNTITSMDTRAGTFGPERKTNGFSTHTKDGYFYQAPDKRIYKLNPESKVDEPVKRKGRDIKPKGLSMIGTTTNTINLQLPNFRLFRHAYPEEFMPSMLPLVHSHGEIQFFPFVLARYARSQEKEHKDAEVYGSTGWKSFRVLNMARGKISWKSKPYFQSNYSISKYFLFYQDGFAFYILKKPLPSKSKYERKLFKYFLLIFNTKTGRFPGVFYITQDNSNNFFSLERDLRQSHWLVKNGIYYLIKKNRVLAIDLKKMQNAFPLSDFLIPAKPAQKEVENFIGKLP